MSILNGRVTLSVSFLVGTRGTTMGGTEWGRRERREEVVLGGGGRRGAENEKCSCTFA